MRIFIKDGTAYVPFSKRVEGYGVKRKGKIILHPVEVAYLTLRKDAIVIGDEEMSLTEVLEWCMERVKNFIPMYCVYEDLKSRGRRVKVFDSFISGNFVFYPVEETDEVRIKDLAEFKFERFVLSILDQENEITYYKVEEFDPVGQNEEEEFKAKGFLIENRIFTDDFIHRCYFYGSLKGDRTVLSILEGAYLVEKGWLEVYRGKRELSFDDLIEIGRRKDPRFERRFEVYRDLKDRKFVVKTGLKFGSDFRLYESPKDQHSKYLVTIVDEVSLNAFEIVRAVRLAQSVKKVLMLVFKDEKNRYVKFERVKV